MVGYLHPAYHNPGRDRNVEKWYGGKSDFKNVKFRVKFRDVHVSISDFGYENK